MLSVDDALARILAAFAPLPAETVPLEQAAGRTLAEEVRARLTQPPQAMSAMDGYAVRTADEGPRRLIGSAPAGHPFAGKVGVGETVRIFTGGVVPEGADAVIIQENARAEGKMVNFTEAPRPGRHIRRAGLDFREGEVLAASGRVLNARDLALIAAGDVAELSVTRRPVVAFAATGDELSRPGAAHKQGGLVASTGYGLSALIAEWGGMARDLGIFPDREEELATIAEKIAGADLLITLGGASVGEHDLVQRALATRGLKLDFWKIAMRPGKPLMFGQLGPTPLIGLPGNPVSSLVCALLFVRPALARMLGRGAGQVSQTARLDGELPANDGRQDHLRATLASRDGVLWAKPRPAQDSSMMKLLAESDALIVRPPHAPSLGHGAVVDILRW